MEKGKRINSKLKQLFSLTWPSRRKFATSIDVPFTTLNGFISQNRNLTFKHFVRVLDGLGVDLEQLIDQTIQNALGSTKVDKRVDNDDLAILINGLERNQRVELIKKAINLNKLRNNTKVTEVIERIEKTQLH